MADLDATDLSRCPHCGGELAILFPLEMIDEIVAKQDAVIDAMANFFPLIGRLADSPKVHDPGSLTAEPSRKESE